jgi:prepilin-type processing-associated H-X9-DG protein
MDENLLGYLLGALDPEAQRQVEALLARDEAARLRLQELRQALAPLEADRDEIEPPPYLAPRTIARVAEHCCQGLPRAPRPSGAGGGRPVWRRADWFVAASLFALVCGLGASWLGRLRSQRDILACQDNLREFYTGLRTYSQSHHNRFPNVANAADSPKNVAGLVIPILVSNGELPRGTMISCPAVHLTRGPALPLEEVLTMNDAEFQRQSARLAAGYAYSLGFRDALGECQGPVFDPDQDNAQLPLMSDSPPVDLRVGNSPNHGGGGQNVLYADGHVRFCTHRAVGVGGDDIFVNRKGEVCAGLDRFDAVLGRSTASPIKRDDDDSR